jgi:hypothetical protein
MIYVRLTIRLKDGSSRSGVRPFSDGTKLEDIRSHAWQLSAEILGMDAIAEVFVQELRATDPAVAALLMFDEMKKIKAPASDGQHPFAKQQQRKHRH